MTTQTEPQPSHRAKAEAIAAQENERFGGLIDGLPKNDANSNPEIRTAGYCVVEPTYDESLPVVLREIEKQARKLFNGEHVNIRLNVDIFSIGKVSVTFSAYRADAAVTLPKDTLAEAVAELKEAL